MLAIIFLLPTAQAATAETRTLKLYFLHTRERAEITYKRNGRYIQSGLDQVNRFLRDWRRNEPTKMDPRLLDLLWEVYRQSGSRDYIHVVSAYRSPQTNAMLRSRSNGVAEKSQHMLGKAVDFYLPDVKLSRLRNAGLQMQAGGVGYYPRSGSPFVHLDVGSVRHWPRMSRKELASVFPDGKTLHVPSDGKPLPGYEQALASYQARQRSGGSIQIANDSGGGNRGRGLLAALFGGGADEEEDNADTQVAAAPARQAQPQPVQQQVQPQPETPATVLAALPARALPVPRSAPRPNIDVGSPLPVEPAIDPEAAQEPETENAAVQVALNVPLPTRRPDYTPVQVAEADDEFLPAAAYVTPTRRPEPSRSKDVIAEILTAQKDEAMWAEGTVPATARNGADDAEYAVAALTGVPASLPERASVSEAIASVKASGAGPVEASPRVELLKNNGRMSPAAVISGGIKTTPKGPKPRPQDARPEPKPMVLPVEVAMAEVVLSRESVLNKTQRTKRPTFNALIAEAPKAVYTAGFQQQTAVADARRFTGKAVTFLSVAKFE